jgi:undecaprenyl-diphosphatase
MWVYILLGTLQGIFEWLPISSEGVVALSSELLLEGVNPVDIALFLHLGTLVAVLVYFRKDWKEVIRFKNPVLLRFLVIATLVSLAIGYPCYQLIHNIAAGAVLLLVMGAGLLLTALFHRLRRGGDATLDNGSNKLAVLAGLLQGLAVIPGLSRSGSTIFGLSLGRLSPLRVLKISYMMSAPVVLASTAYVVMKNPVLVEGWPALFTSFIVGMISLSLLMRIAERINFTRFALVFAMLCIIGGIITLSI